MQGETVGDREEEGDDLLALVAELEHALALLAAQPLGDVRASALEKLADQVNDELRRSGRAIVVVSEGFDVGNLGELRDSFGHVAFSSSQTTVCQVVVNYLNLKKKGKSTTFQIIFKFEFFFKLSSNYLQI